MKFDCFLTGSFHFREKEATVFASSSVEISFVRCSSIKARDCSIASYVYIAAPPIFDVQIISFYFLPGFSRNALFD